jgi:hypothetical protein
MEILSRFRRTREPEPPVPDMIEVTQGDCRFLSILAAHKGSVIRSCVSDRLS